MLNKKLYITIGVLIVVVGVFAFMNRELVKDKGYSLENAEVIIREGEMERVLGYEEIKALGESDFSAVLDTSTTDPEEHTYTGVPLKRVIEEAGISLDGKGKVVVRAIDGYTVALRVDEVLDEDNVYLAYGMDGRPLKSKSQGGSGPYQIIVRKDQFSQRWCKFVVEIEVI